MGRIKEKIPVEHEEAISIHREAPPPLVHHGGSHGKEGKDEEDEGLSFGDQVPVNTVRVSPGVICPLDAKSKKKSDISLN